jgi:hypothetical protein
MDHFGIGNAVRSLFHTLLQTSRGTGRTTSLINSVRDGDRIICSESLEQQRLRREFHRMGRDVSVEHIPPNFPEEVLRLTPCAGRTLFDHTWVERYYALALERAAEDIDHLQARSSRIADLLGRDKIAPMPNRNWPI